MNEWNNKGSVRCYLQIPLLTAISLTPNAMVARGSLSKPPALVTHNNVLEGFPDYDVLAFLPPSHDLFSDIRLQPLNLTGSDNAMKKYRKTIRCKIHGNGHGNTHKGGGLQSGPDCHRCSVFSIHIVQSMFFFLILCGWSFVQWPTRDMYFLARYWYATLAYQLCVRGQRVFPVICLYLYQEWTKDCFKLLIN